MTIYNSQLDYSESLNLLQTIKEGLDNALADPYYQFGGFGAETINWSAAQAALGDDSAQTAIETVPNLIASYLAGDAVDADGYPSTYSDLANAAAQTQQLIENVLAADTSAFPPPPTPVAPPENNSAGDIQASGGEQPVTTASTPSATQNNTGSTASNGSTTSPGSTNTSTTTIVQQTIQQQASTPSQSISGGGVAVQQATQQAATTDDDVLKAVGDLDAAWFTFIPSAASAVVKWIEENIIDPLIAFFVWLGGLILGIFGLGYIQGEGITYTSKVPAIPLPTTQQELNTIEPVISSIINNPTNVFEYAASIWVKVWIAITAAAARLEPLIEEVRQASNTASPTGTLATSDLVDGIYKGNTNYTYGETTALKQSISKEDFLLLYQNSSYTPSLAEAASWYYRGLITEASYNAYAASNHAAAEESSTALSNYLKPQNGADLIAANGRLQAGAGGLFSSELAGGAPADILPSYTAQQQSEQQANLDWINHFQLPSPEWFAQAAARGLLPASYVSLAATAANYPSEIANIYAKMAAPQIGERIIVTLYSKGVLTLTQAQSHFQSLGYSTEDVATLIAYAESIIVKPTKATAGDYSKLAIADAQDLYIDGAINQSQLLTIYEQHGYSADAANLAIQYLNLKQVATQRKENALYIVDQVDLGTITYDAGVAQLYSGGYTPIEVNRYEKMMKQAKAAKNKLPTVAEIQTAYASGYITDGDVEDFVSLSGYQEPWAAAMVQLISAGKINPTDGG